MTTESTWLLPTPRGALHAFSTHEPGAAQRATQALLASPRAMSLADWRRGHDQTGRMLEQLRDKQWVQLLKREVPAPDVRLGDFAQHVIAPLSGERRAILASDSGFCLGQSGLEQEQADTLSAAAADFSSYALRQARRGWPGARHVSFFSDPDMLLPEWSFVPFWVDDSGYWLILAGEPLLNNLAMVELVWSIRLAGARFAAPL
ncbi:hypothetical protein OK348_08820 [Flavobacterium sp. MXW15]|uniref:Uncharacterized protein n=1 Tax=Xanthomonas chitinilytica TaxID=2989819 RepID=A0ABT3JVE7_9XANT|nr:hypothetical protein [Xanthomonas sp. H13-6]MCW4454899.1 hypothetical protein [Flavobacterium sp. MXW15]MCW4472473.1 hypothetical protein [Xanthomonas sp. H13-6]